MARRFRGNAVAENVQTGDGRVWAPGAFTWEIPAPFAWIEAGDQHVDVVMSAPQIGVIDEMARAGDVIEFGGVIDDTIPAGAELVRRMDAGTASHGHRQGVSVDPDDWAFEVIVTDAEAEDVVMMASTGEGRSALASTRLLPRNAARMAVQPVTAAAGEPDPGPGGGDDGVVLFEDASDAWLLRFNRSRIRGATACAVQAFDMAWIELEAAGTDDAAVPSEGDGEGVAASAPAPAPSRSRSYTAPPREWFDVPEPTADASGAVDVYGMPAQELVVEQPDGQLGVPLTIVERTDHGGALQVYGNAALWDSCHVGYLPDCVTPPDSPSGYAHFHLGEVVCADGSTVAAGPLSVGCDHAAARLLAPEARDHYAHVGLTFADVRASSGAFGPWVAGACRPLTDEQLAVVRASSLSGDWRRIGGALEFIAALAVAVPGFPIAREAVTAAAFPMVAAASTPRVHSVDGEVRSLVAAGVVQRCPDCAARARARRDRDDTDRPLAEQLDRIEATLRTVELRTRGMRTDARDDLVARIRNGR